MVYFIIHAHTYGTDEPLLQVVLLVVVPLHDRNQVEIYHAFRKLLLLLVARGGGVGGCVKLVIYSSGMSTTSSTTMTGG